MLGVIARCDDTGLGNQTRSYVQMLRPERIMVVDSTPFSKNSQHFEWYDGFMVQPTKGWPTNLESSRFIRGLTHVLTAETAYNYKVYELARLYKTKVFTAPNWEFLDHINDRRLPKPHMWLMPSYWHLEDMKALYPNTVYLPPPVIMANFKDARMTNIQRNSYRRFVHVMGKVATHDRNGTFDLIDSLKYSTAQFELVIRSQNPIPEYMELAKDDRIRFDIGNVADPQDMYKNFDAMIIPRRYGGLCLPMNEALASGLPVIMPDISPNNKVLPDEWLVPAEKTHDFMARTKIDVYRSDIISLGKKLDFFAEMDNDALQDRKLQAYDIAMNNYSSETLKPQYEKVMGL